MNYNEVDSCVTVLPSSHLTLRLWDGFPSFKRQKHWAGGTHPTGMHSCWTLILKPLIDKVMSRNQWHKEVQCYLMFKGVAVAVELKCVSFHVFLCKGDVMAAAHVNSQTICTLLCTEAGFNICFEKPNIFGYGGFLALALDSSSSLLNWLCCHKNTNQHFRK